MKKLVFTVTNDLTYDQRMIRICTSLANNGYLVLLVGRKMTNSLSLKKMAFEQKRLHCIFSTGKFFYAEYNLRLFFYLLFKKLDLICAIDLDTIIPCLWISKIRRKKRVYDAHELFCEMKEIVKRPAIYKIWKNIEKNTVPAFEFGYTVNDLLKEEFREMYNRDYAVIMSTPLLRPLVIPEKNEKYILYQGAVNEGRSFETLIPAMKEVKARLIVAGDGNLMKQTKQLVRENGLEDKISFIGKIAPGELLNYTLGAYIGLTLFENKGLSNYYSLANRFFDYFHSGVPQLCVDYPVYRELNKTRPVAVLTADLSSKNIAHQLNFLLENDVVYKELQENCLYQREIMNWQTEEKKLLAFYDSILSE